MINPSSLGAGLPSPTQLLDRPMTLQCWTFESIHARFGSLVALVSPLVYFLVATDALFSVTTPDRRRIHTRKRITAWHPSHSQPSSAMSSDFDEIFGDLKEDQGSAPTLTTDLDEASIFGDSGKPTLVAKEAPAAPTPAADQSGSSKQPWESIGSREQDDFLSWLDDGSAPSAGLATPSDSSCDPSAFSTVEIDDEGAGAHVVSPLPPVKAAPEASLPPPIPVHSHSEPHGVSNVSLDDDDDDDYLEKIIEKAKQQQQASSSRENSDTSLQIKSQLNAQREQEQIGTQAS